MADTQGLANYGTRIDGTLKGTGWLGELQAHNGDVMTELSSTFGVDGQEILMPLLVPTLTEAETLYLLQGKQPTVDIQNKAFQHGINRIMTGRSPFITEEDTSVTQGLENYRIRR